jgi:NOL1/NOP2/fmu family ribosome biogenesis protein
VIAFFETQFGVARAWLNELTFDERQGEIWATSASLIPPLASPRLPGLRILRRAPGGLKPTSVFLALLADRITARRVDTDLDRLRKLLLGQWIPTDASDGHCAIVFRADVLGCGRVRDGRVRALIPTGRRRELLNALSHFEATE